MTAVAPAAGQTHPAAVRWRHLVGAAWRQHRTAWAASIAVAGFIAIAMAVTGVALHPYGRNVTAAGPHSPWHLYDVTRTALMPTLLLLPVLAGLLLGAPLVARDYETGATRFTWVQGAGRVRCLAAAVLTAAAPLAVTAAALGLEFRWWITPLSGPRLAWQPEVFGVSPLPYLGWTLFGFSLGVFLGAAIARTVAAMAATFACYAALWYQVSSSWRMGYLTPLRRAVAMHVSGSGYSYGWSYGPGQPPFILNSYLGWPDGQPLSGSLNHPAAWYSQHHIEMWLSYQPATRLGTFQLIETGWLIALTAVLIAATFAVTSRRAA